MLATRRQVVCLFLMALAVRASVVCMSLWGVGPLGQLTEDPDAYRLIAESFASSGIFGVPGADGKIDPTAFRPPLYPWLLSWFVFDSGEGKPELNLLAVAALHSILGAITAVSTSIAVDSWVRGLSISSSQEESEPHGGRLFRGQLFRGWPNRGWGPFGVSIGFVAGLLVTFDPLLLMQSTLVMTETLATAIAAVTWMLVALAASGRSDWDEKTSSDDALRRSRIFEWSCWLAASLFLALGFLCRPTFVVWTFGLGLFGTLRFVLGSLRARQFQWRELAIGWLMIVATGAAVFAWTARNQRVIGVPVWATTHGGYTLLLGNNPYFYEYLKQESFLSAAVIGEAWDAEPFHRDWQTRLDGLRAESSGDDLLSLRSGIDREVPEDELAGQWAKQTIREQPSMFVYSVLIRVARLWTPVPRAGQQVSVVSLMIGGYYTLIYTLCVIAVMRFGKGLAGRHGQKAWVGLAALMLVGSLTVVHAVYWSNVRMRAPAIPVILGLASMAVAGGLASPLGRVKH